MSGQVKLPENIKREIAVFSAATHRTQGSLLADAWREYRRNHAGELSEGLQWAQAVLADPVEASVQASGMSGEDLAELRDAFES